MSEWISVKEKLPTPKPEGGYPTVMVYDAAWDTQYLAWWNANGGYWEPTSERSAPVGVTHWMPLPAPPEVADEHQD